MSKGKKLLYVVMSLVGLVVFFWCALPFGIGIIHLGMIIPMILGIILTLYCLLSLKYPMEDIPWKKDQDAKYKMEMEMVRCNVAGEKPKMRRTILLGMKNANLEEYDKEYEITNRAGLVFSRETRVKIDKVVWILVGICVVVFIGLSALLWTGYDEYDGTFKDETVVTLGCKVNGNRPSRQLRHRLEATVDFLKENPSAKCIVTGGQGTNEVMPESKVMKEYLVEKGISEKRIFMEDKSTDTKENLEYAKKVAKENKLNKKFIIVTESYHEYRANKYAKELGISSMGYPAKTERWLWLSYWCREMFALVRDVFV